MRSLPAAEAPLEKVRETFILASIEAKMLN